MRTPAMAGVNPFHPEIYGVSPPGSARAGVNWN
jgi:hypothetical protein